MSKEEDQLKKIMMILPDFGYGGAERSFSKLSVELAKHFEVSIVVFNTDIEQVYEVGGKIYSLNINKANSFYKKLTNLSRRIRALKKLKRKIKPDVSISFLEGANLINQLSATKDKTVLSIRGSIFNDQNLNNITGLFYRYILVPLIYDKADKIITLSHGIKEEFLKQNTRLASDKVRTIYNAIDINSIDSMAVKTLSKDWQNIFNKYKVIVMSSRIAIEKGIQHFLPIFKQLHIQDKNIRLLIIGDGPYEYEVKLIARQLGLQIFDGPNDQTNDNYAIWFIGKQTNPFKWLSKARIFVSASLHEGFGNSILEALACKIPVVSSDCLYGPREILSGVELRTIKYPYQTDYGILLPLANKNNSSDLWVNTIQNLLNNSEQLGKFGNKGRERATDFSQQSITENWLDVINLL